MYAWGSTIHGELGLGGVEDEHILTPKLMDWTLANTVIEAALGANHTLLLTKDGKVFSCGSNDFGQLGHDQPRKRPQQVTGLDAYKITHIACGATHSLALNQWGQVFSWGSDYHGQIAQQLGENIQSVPKIIRPLAKYCIVQIACGQKHSVALSNGGDILTWGANSFGQLGLGVTSPIEAVPKEIRSLRGIPVAFITCGANHSFCISKSGAVFGWGKNTKGQLGLNDTANRIFPNQLRTLRNIRVCYIGCGDEFSMFLTLDGGVLTCGSGIFGQLGHGTLSNEILPRQIVELMGSTISQISCGHQHSLALVPAGHRVYSFGIGGSGQLGLRKTTNASTPQVVLGPWVQNGNIFTNNTTINRIYAGGNHCLLSIANKKDNNFDCRIYDPSSQILTLNYNSIKDLQEISSSDQVDQEILSYLETVFRSLSCINGSFLLDQNRHYGCNSKHHGLDMELAEKTFSIIGTLENMTIKELIWNCIVEDIIPTQLKADPPDVETLRAYLTLPLYHEFNNPKQYLTLQTPFATAVLRLSKQASRVVECWWNLMHCDYFERMVNVFKSVAWYILRNQHVSEGQRVKYDSSLVAMLDLLGRLHKLNKKCDKLSYDMFHLPEICDHFDIRIDYFLWLTEGSPGKFFLCNYPFIFDAKAKMQLLETDQSIQMHNAMHQAAQQSMLAIIFGSNAVNQFLVINVTRDNIVEDTLKELSRVDPNDLKKPMKVKFSGEEAEDAGGVKKEFFMLLLRDILDPKYGMFKEYEETRSIWFSENSFEDNAVYFLIGMICGLAIYNFIIIDIPFPLAMYKKLLSESINLADLKGLSPSTANSLQSLLDYEGDDFEDVFALSFEITRDVWGEATVVELKPGGSDIPVNQGNKAEYVDLYVDYILTKSVTQQFTAFHQGFMKVCGGRVLQLFQAHELMAVVVGNENYDWHALEDAAEYKNGYKSSDPTIRWFWEVLHEMSLEDKKKFLLFLTGCDRIPIQGMKAIKIIIQPTNDEKFLPVAHTCFNLLDLPRYKTKERLRYKLLQAIQQTQGFSLV